MLRDSKVIPEYKSDLFVGGTDPTLTNDSKGIYNNVPFKIKTGFADTCLPGRYQDNPGSICGGNTKLFSMRKLVATFGPNTAPGTSGKEGSKVEFPVDDIAGLKDDVADLKKCGAVCIDLVGERWKIIPQSIGGQKIYTPDSTVIVLKFGQKIPSTSGKVNYKSDGLSGTLNIGDGDLDVIATVKWESDPTDFARLIEDCIGKPDTSKGCAIARSGFKHRRLVAIGTSATTDGTGADDQLTAKDKKVFRREVPVDRSGAYPLACITSFASFKGIQCWAYKGEDIKNIHLYL